MIIERRRILGSFAVLALVLLRLVTGWHFLGEGTKKVEYDRHDRQFPHGVLGRRFPGAGQGAARAALSIVHPRTITDAASLLVVAREQQARPAPEQSAELVQWAAQLLEAPRRSAKEQAAAAGRVRAGNGGARLGNENCRRLASHGWEEFKKVPGLAEQLKSNRGRVRLSLCGWMRWPDYFLRRRGQTLPSTGTICGGCPTGGGRTREAGRRSVLRRANCNQVKRNGSQGGRVEGASSRFRRRPAPAI